MSKQQITDPIFNLQTDSRGRGHRAPTAGLRILILAPIVKDRKGEYTELFTDLKKRGYKKARIDRRIYGLDEDIVLIKTNKHTIEAVIDSIVLTKETDKLRVSNDVEQALKLGNGELIAAIVNDKGFEMPEKPKLMEDELFSEKFACPVCNISISEIEPRIFSFNTPHGACPNCNGLGNVLTVDSDLVFNDNLTIGEGGILPFANAMMHDTWFTRTLKTFAEENGIPTNIRLEDVSEEKKYLLLHGTGNKQYEVEGENKGGRATVIHEPFKGIIDEVKKRYQATDSMFMRGQMEKFMRYETCPVCKGSRLKKEALSVTIDKKSIVEVADMPIDNALLFIKNLTDLLSTREIQIGNIIIKEIKERLNFLVDVGLDYLTLSRGANTLAGGEAQRIRLASQIGSGLTGVLYVLDEPSIGLHPKDNEKLIKTLKKLRDLDNTVLVVEHDQETMEASDMIIDFGPAAGEHGGNIIAQGTIEEIKNNPNSITGQYLSGKKKIHILPSEQQAIIDQTDLSHSRRRSNPSWLPQGSDDIPTRAGTRPAPTNSHVNEITIKGAKEHNLKNIDVSFPLNKLTVVTGASGSGKSTLVNDILYKALQQKNNPFTREKAGEFASMAGDNQIKHVFAIDQSPIGRTPRSNPATYTGSFTYIRDIFTKSKEAKLRGYGPGRFSFNVKGGRCEACEGEGQIKIEMQFLPDVYIPCEVCGGTQYNREALEIQFNGKNIAEVLDMTVEEALKFFNFYSPLSHKLQTLSDVGLSYIELGQPAPTLSGGEAQRVKLATELSKRGRDALYLLDEPTTGLHFADLEKLLKVLRKLVDIGNTVIVIEHNLDVIKNADYIIDLGPDGGDKGGEIVALGTPKEVAANNKSYTGQFLKKVL